MFRMKWSLLILPLLFVLVMALPTSAQFAPTATPVQIDLSVGLSEQQQLSNATPTATWTPTPLGIAQIEAGELANVRAAPDPNAEILGQIRAGNYYNAIRQYYQWIEFQFDASPTRRGWVFAELVNVIGTSPIPQVETLDDDNTQDIDFEIESTQSMITLTPGALLTMTAISRTVVAPIIEQGDQNAPIEMLPQEALPTFTYPPGIVALAPTEAPTDDANVLVEITAPSTSPVSTSRFPPILPVAILGGFGLLGLLVSSIRR